VLILKVVKVLCFHDGAEGVRGEIIEEFEKAAGPSDLDGVNFGGVAEAEMDAEVGAGG
jgi:hypothetical protein